MGKKKGDGVPTIGTKNLGKQKYQDVEIAEDIAPNGYGTTKLNNNEPQSYKKEKIPKPGEDG